MKLKFWLLFLFFYSFSNEYTQEDIRCELENCLADGYPLLQCKSDLARCSKMSLKLVSLLSKSKGLQQDGKGEKSENMNQRIEVLELKDQNSSLKKEIEQLKNGLDIWEDEYKNLYKKLSSDEDEIYFEIEDIKNRISGNAKTSIPSDYDQIIKEGDEAAEFFENLETQNF